MSDSRSPPRTFASLVVLALVFFVLYNIAYAACRVLGWASFTAGAESALLSLMAAQVAESKFKQWRQRRAQREAARSWLE